MSKTNTKSFVLENDVLRFIKSVDVSYLQTESNRNTDNTSTERKFRLNIQDPEMVQDNIFIALQNYNILKPNLGVGVVSFESDGYGWRSKRNEVEHNNQQDMFIYLLNKYISDHLKGVENKHQKRKDIYNFAKELDIKDKRQYGYPERYNGKLKDDELLWSERVENYYSLSIDLRDVIESDNRECLLFDSDTFNGSYYSTIFTQVKLDIELGYNDKTESDDGNYKYDFNINKSTLQLQWKTPDNERRTHDLTGGEVEWKYSANRVKKWVKQVKYDGGRFSDTSRQVSFNTYVIYMREMVHRQAEDRKHEIIRSARLLNNETILQEMYPDQEIVKETMWKSDVKKLTHKSKRGAEKISYSRHYYGEKNYKVLFKSGSYLVYEKSSMEGDDGVDNAYLGAFDITWEAPKLKTHSEMYEKFNNQKQEV